MALNTSRDRKALRRTYWSCAVVPAGGIAGDLLFFSSYLGDSNISPIFGGATKTQLVDTNMRVPGGLLRQNEIFDVDGIRVTFLSPTPLQAANGKDIATLQRSGVVTIKLADAKILEEPLLDFNAGVGVVVGGSTTNAATEAISATNGSAVANNYYHLPPGMGFRMDGNNAVDVRINWAVATGALPSGGGCVIKVQFLGNYNGPVIG